MKQQKIGMATFTIFTVLLLTACNQTPVTETKSNETNNSINSSSSAIVQSQPSLNVYDMNAKVGQKYGEMSLQKIGPALEKRSIADNNLHAEFIGNITIYGEYEYIDNDESMFIGKGSACFTVKMKDSVQKMPVSKLDSELTQATEKFFCFKNPEKAKTLLGKLKKAARITISSYIDDSFEGESLDTAVLESVEN